MWDEQLPYATIIEEPTIAGVQGLGDSAVAIRLMAKTEPGEQFATGRELRGRLKEALDGAGIEIPFPQRTVWVKSEPPADRPAGQRRPPAVDHSVLDATGEIGDIDDPDL